MTQGRRTFLAFGAVFAAWALVVPVGVVSSGTYAWSVPDPRGTVHGTTRHEVRGVGMPGGPFRRGATTWQAALDDGTTVTPLEVTPELRARVIELGQAFAEEGAWVSWSDLGLSCALGVFFTVVTSLWWLALRGRVVKPGATRVEVLLGAALMALWPWLLFTSNGLVLWEHLDRPKVPGALLAPETMVVTTAALAGLCLSLLFIRRPEEA